MDKFLCEEMYTNDEKTESDGPLLRLASGLVWP